MKFYKYLYCGASIKKNRRKMCWKLRHNAGQLQIYVITLALEDNQLDIYHCAYLQQKYNKEHAPFIIGIAKGYDEAIALLQVIVMDVFEKTGTADIKDYIQKQV